MNHLAAIGAKKIFQSLDLPDLADTGGVRARFENGLLKITAKFAAPKVTTTGSRA
jgi:HSP20 family molecular chaperone IbpA